MYCSFLLNFNCDLEFFGSFSRSLGFFTLSNQVCHENAPIAVQYFSIFSHLFKNNALYPPHTIILLIRFFSSTLHDVFRAISMI